MGNQQGTHGHGHEREIKNSDHTTGDHEAHVPGEMKGEGAATSHEHKEETESEKTIDKYQVVENEEKTLEVSTMATNTEVSDEIVPPIKSTSDGKEKDTSYVDIQEVGEETKTGEKSPLVMKSPTYEEMKEKAPPVEEEKEKASDVTVGERELLLAKETSGEMSESVSNTPNDKVTKLNRSSSLFRSCICCIQASS